MSKRSLISELSEEQIEGLLDYIPNFSEKNMENIKKLSLEKINSQESQIRRKLSMRKMAVIAAAAMLLIATSTVIFAAAGGLEQFLSRFNPNFGEFAIAPLYPAYAEDEGIRIEAVGAQQIGHVVLVYMAVQDLSGENRLTRHMSADLEIFVDGQFMNGPSSGRRLNFDRTANTIYFEKIMVGEVGMPKSDSIELRINRIICTEHSGQIRTVIEGDWSMVVNTSDLGIQPIVWTDLPVGDVLIEYMSLSPFGLQMTGSHLIDVCELRSFLDFTAEIEFENRRRNARFRGIAGSYGPDDFSYFSFLDAPIDLDSVTAVVINGERIPIPVE